MDIKAFSQVNLAQNIGAKTSVARPTTTIMPPDRDKIMRNRRVISHVAGAVILAGLGFYGIRTKNNAKTIAKNLEEAKGSLATALNSLKSKEEIIAQNNKKIAELDELVLRNAEKGLVEKETAIKEAVEKAIAEKEAAVNETVEKAVSEKEAQLTEAFNKKLEEREKAIKEAAAKEIAEKTGQPPKEPKIKKKTRKEILTETTKKILENMDLHKKEIIEKIERNRNSQQSEITRIINENIKHNNRVDMPMMVKIAKDYIADKGRGEERLHQAADLMEQALIRDNVRGDKRQIGGLHLYLNGLKEEPFLYTKIYAKMPFEEAATRIKYLSEHDLQSDWYTHGIPNYKWFDASMEMLVKKLRMHAPEA